jgi:hypothetical protein
MKKILISTVITLAAGLANAANFVSVDVDTVKDTTTNAKSTAQYFRAGTDVAGLNVGLQVRTAVFDNGGMLNSVEGTVGRNFGAVNVFGGIGHDNGFNGARGGDYQYGLVGASVGVPIGPFYGYAGVKTRVNWQDNTPKQTVGFAGVSYPLNKKFSINAGVSASRQDITENAWSIGLRAGF